MSGTSRRADAVAAAVSLAWAGGLTTAVALRLGDLSSMLHVGGPNAAPRWLPDGVRAQAMSRSYDGMFFYRLALAPFSDREWVDGIRLDAPALRASRPVYPLLARSVGWGHPQRTVVAMVLVNVVAAMALGVAGTRLARAAGRPWLWGLVVLVIPGVTYGLALSLADVVAIALVVAALVAYQRERWAVAAALLAVGVLTRESTLLWVGAITLGTVLRPELRRRPGAWAVVAAPALSYAAWQGVVTITWDQSGLGRSGAANIGPPFLGLARSIDGLVPRDGPSALRFVLLGFLAVVLALALASSVRTPRPPVHVTVALGLGVLLLASLTAEPFSNAPNFGRAADETIVAVVAVGLWGRSRPASAVLAVLAAGGVVLAGWTVWASAPVA